MSLFMIIIHTELLNFTLKVCSHLSLCGGSYNSCPRSTDSCMYKCSNKDLKYKYKQWVLNLVNDNVIFCILFFSWLYGFQHLCFKLGLCDWSNFSFNFHFGFRQLWKHDYQLLCHIQLLSFISYNCAVLSFLKKYIKMISLACSCKHSRLCSWYKVIVSLQKTRLKQLDSYGFILWSLYKRFEASEY